MAVCTESVVHAAEAVTGSSERPAPAAPSSAANDRSHFNVVRMSPALSRAVCFCSSEANEGISVENRSRTSLDLFFRNNSMEVTVITASPPSPTPHVVC